MSWLDSNNPLLQYIQYSWNYNSIACLLFIYVYKTEQSFLMVKQFLCIRRYRFIVFGFKTKILNVKLYIQTSYLIFFFFENTKTHHPRLNVTSRSVSYLTNWYPSRGICGDAEVFSVFEIFDAIIEVNSKLFHLRMYI